MKALERIARMLTYDPATGHLAWLVKPSRGVKVGARAGWVKLEGYICVKQEGDVEYGHRLAWKIMTGHAPPNEIDHRNGVKHDNTWTNLRDVTSRMNKQNARHARSDSKSGLIGAMQNKRGFMARIKVGNRILYLGTFRTAQEASETYIAAKRIHHQGNTL